MERVASQHYKAPWDTDASEFVPIKFHSSRGCNISLFGNGFKARCKCKQGGGGGPSSNRVNVVFSCRTIRVNEKVGLRVTEFPQGATIAVGFTSYNPTTISQELCNSNFTKLNTTPGFWFMCPENASNTDSIDIHFYVNFYGDIRLKIDNEDIIGNGLCIPEKHLSNLWAMVYLLCPSSIVEITHFRSTNPQLMPTLHKNVNLLNLHPTRGKNVKIAKEKGVAERIETEVCQGYVFSALPMLPNRTVVIQILATESGYAGSLAFGVTSRDPSSIRPLELPDNAERLTERTRMNEEFWKVKHSMAENLKSGDVLMITRNFNGHIRLGTNKKMPVTCMVVEPKQTLWLFVDIYGATQKIKMYEEKVENVNNSRPETRVHSRFITGQPSTNKHQLQRNQNNWQLQSSSSWQERQQQVNPAGPSQPTIAGETAEASLPSSNQPAPLRFHSTQYGNMETSHNRSRARTTCGITGLAYSDRPIKVDEKVCFRILEEPLQYGIKIGFTYFGPNSPNNFDLAGMSHCLVLNQTICKKDTIIRYWVNNSGHGICNIGDVNLGLVRITDVIEGHLWAFLYIGMGAVVEFCNPNDIPGVKLQEDVLPPLSLRDTRGKNIWHVKAAARDHYIFYEGFVFTANPMRLKQTLVVNNLVSVFLSVGLSFGLTTCDPATLRMSDLPTTLTQGRPDTWIVDFDCASDLRLNSGEKLVFKLAVDGRVYVKKNGRVLHILRMHIDHKQTLWGFVNIREKDPPIISPILPSIHHDQEDTGLLEDDSTEEESEHETAEGIDQRQTMPQGIVPLEDDSLADDTLADDNVTQRTEEESEQDTAEGIDQRQTMPQISPESELILTPAEEAWINESQPVVTEQWEEIPPEWLQGESATTPNDLPQQSSPTSDVRRERLDLHLRPHILPGNMRDQATVIEVRPASTRPAVIQVGSGTTRAQVTQLGPGTTRSAVTQLGPGTTRPAVTQVGPGTTRLAGTQVGLATIRPAVAEVKPATTRPAVTQVGPGTTRTAVTQLGPGTTRPAVTQVGPGTTRLAGTQVGLATIRPAVAEVEPATTRPPVTEAELGVTRPVITLVGPGTTRPAVTQLGPGITRPAVMKVGPTTRSPSTISPGTIKPAVTQEGPETTRPPVTDVGPGTTRPAVTDEEPGVTEVRPRTAEIFNQSIPVYDCIICFDAPINSALSECGHMYMCYECAVEQWKGRGDGLCPICRRKIEKVIRIYKP